MQLSQSSQPAPAAVAAAASTGLQLRRTQEPQFEQGSHTVLCRVILSKFPTGNGNFKTEITETAGTQLTLDLMMEEQLKKQHALHQKSILLYQNGWRRSEKHEGACEILLNAAFSDRRTCYVTVDSDKVEQLLAYGPWGAKLAGKLLYACTPDVKAPSRWMHEILAAPGMVMAAFRDLNPLILTFDNIEWTTALSVPGTIALVSQLGSVRVNEHNPDHIPGLEYVKMKKYRLRFYQEGKRTCISFSFNAKWKKDGRPVYASASEAYEAAKQQYRHMAQPIEEREEELKMEQANKKPRLLGRTSDRATHSPRAGRPETGVHPESEGRCVDGRLGRLAPR